MDKRNLKLIVGILGLFLIFGIILSAVYLIPTIYTSFSDRYAEVSYKSSATAGQPAGALYIDVSPASKQVLEAFEASPDQVKSFESQTDYFQPFVVNLNTHLGSLDSKKYDSEWMIDHVFVRTSDGREFSSVGGTMTISTHHNTYILFFPKADRQGKPVFENVDYVEIFTKDLCKNPPCSTGEQSVRLDVPLKTGGTSIKGGPVTLLFMILAVTIVIMAAATPCTIPFVAFFAAVLPASVTLEDSESGGKLKDVLDEDEWAYVKKNEIAFIAGHMTILMLLGIALGFTKFIFEVTDSKNVFGGYLMQLQILFGTILAFYAFKFMGLYRYDPIEKVILEIKLRAMKYLPVPETAQNIGERRLTPVSSFFTGMSLSFACIECVGVAILVPVISLFGFIEWTIGVMFIAVLGTMIVVPVLLINYGFSDWLLDLRRKQRLARRMSFISGVMMLFIAILTLTGLNLYYDDWLFRLLGGDRFNDVLGTSYSELQRELNDI